MMRVGNVADMDRSFDIEFWQSQDDTARFDAAWELVVFAHGLKGQTEDELRLQRSVESIERLDFGKEQRAKGEGVSAKGKEQRAESEDRRLRSKNFSNE